MRTAFIFLPDDQPTQRPEGHVFATQKAVNSQTRRRYTALTAFAQGACRNYCVHDT